MPACLRSGTGLHNSATKMADNLKVVATHLLLVYGGRCWREVSQAGTSSPSLGTLQESTCQLTDLAGPVVDVAYDVSGRRMATCTSSMSGGSIVQVCAFHTVTAGRHNPPLPHHQLPYPSCSPHTPLQPSRPVASGFPPVPHTYLHLHTNPHRDPRRAPRRPFLCRRRTSAALGPQAGPRCLPGRRTRP